MKKSKLKKKKSERYDWDEKRVEIIHDPADLKVDYCTDINKTVTRRKFEIEVSIPTYEHVAFFQFLDENKATPSTFFSMCVKMAILGSDTLFAESLQEYSRRSGKNLFKGIKGGTRMTQRESISLKKYEEIKERFSINTINKEGYLDFYDE